MYFPTLPVPDCDAWPTYTFCLPCAAGYSAYNYTERGEIVCADCDAGFSARDPVRVQIVIARVGFRLRKSLCVCVCGGVCAGAVATCESLECFRLSFCVVGFRCVMCDGRLTTNTHLQRFRR